MNIFNTQQLQMNTKGGILGGEAVSGGLENQVSLSPDALKLLEQNSLENGVDFDQVLKATKEGQDPEAVIELLKNSKEGMTQQTGQEVATKTLQQKPNQELSAKSQELNQLLSGEQGKEVSQNIKPVNVNTSEIAKTERTAFFPNKLNGKLATQTGMQGQVTAESALSKANQQIAKNQIGTEQMVKNLDAAHPMKQAVQNNPYQAQSAQSMVGNKQVATQGAKKNNLLSLNNFMAKQSPSLKSNAAKKAYKPLSESMFNKKVDASLPGVTKAPTKETSLQDVLLGKVDNSSEMASKVMETQPGQNMMAKGEATNNAAKVFDINSLSKLDTTADVISKVQDYIVQSKVSGQSQVEMSFDHKELGKVDLMVQKGAGDQLNISIATNSIEAAKFFNKNQVDLLSSLTQSGIQVGEFKLDSSQSSNSQSNSQDSSKQQFAQGQKGQHQSESGQRDQESKKREGLWNQFYDKEVA